MTVLKGAGAFGASVWMAALACLVMYGGVRADPLLDFGLFDVPAPAQLANKAPVVRWLVRADAQTYCSHVSSKDGHASRWEGCVYWERAAGKCTIVTTASTTHSQLGHLFLHCLQPQ